MSKYECIDSQKSDPANQNSVVKMCLWLAVSTSGFYHWTVRPQSATAARREALSARIQHKREEPQYGLLLSLEVASVRHDSGAWHLLGAW